MKSARELYGSRLNELAFVVGPGPSIRQAEWFLNSPHPNSFRIAINSAITKVACEYWFWIDELAYRLSKDHPNAKAAIKLGVDKWKDHYDDDVHLWEPAKKLPEDVQNLKLLHRGTTLIGAINMAALMGSPRVVTVGIDHQFSEEYMRAKMAEVNQGDRKDTWEQIKDYHACTILRVNKALMEMPFWLPKWVSVRDASGGKLPIPKTTINGELAMLDRWHAKQKAKREEAAVK